MRVRIRAAGFDLPPETRRSIERHVHLALGRHAPAVAEVRVGLALGAEPRRDVTRCRTRLRLRGGEVIRVEDLGEDARDAVTRAIWRAALRLDRRGRLGSRPAHESIHLPSRHRQGGIR